MKLYRYSYFTSTKLLLESVLHSTPEFSSIIEILSSRGNSIATTIRNILRYEKDIKTNSNGIGLSDKNDEITFIPDTQFQRFINNNEDPWKKNKSKIKIGRLVRQLLKDNGNSVTDLDIEQFVNLFKSQWDKSNGVSSREIKMVKGRDIKKWYLEDNYLYGNGTLGNSCMRYESTNKFLEIYAQNSHVQLVVLFDEGLVIARAILWKLDNNKYFLDRIYATKDSDVLFLREWVDEQIGPDNVTFYGDSFKGSCNLDNVIFDYYPYADSMCWLYIKVNDGKLVNDGYVSAHREDSKEYVTFAMQSTIGDKDAKTHKYLQNREIWVDKDDLVYCASEYWLKDDLVRLDFEKIDWPKEYSIYSKTMKSWINKDYAITHKKYGIIHKDYLANIITNYIGEETTPFKIYLDIRLNGVKVISYDQIKKKDRRTLPENTFSSDPYIRDESSRSEEFYWDAKFDDGVENVSRSVNICKNEFYIIDNTEDINKYRAFITYYSNIDKYLISKYIMDIINPKHPKYESEQVNSRNLYRIFYELNYKSSIDFINNLEISSDNKNESIKYINDVNDIMTKREYSDELFPYNHTNETGLYKFYNIKGNNIIDISKKIIYLIKKSIDDSIKLENYVDLKGKIGSYHREKYPWDDDMDESKYEGIFILMILFHILAYNEGFTYETTETIDSFCDNNEYDTIHERGINTYMFINVANYLLEVKEIVADNFNDILGFDKMDDYTQESIKSVIKNTLRNPKLPGMQVELDIPQLK